MNHHQTFAFAVLLALCACTEPAAPPRPSSEPEQPPPPPVAAARDTVMKIDNTTDTLVYYRSKTGRIYKMRIAGTDEFQEEGGATDADICGTDEFRGSARKAAKTSIVQANMEDFPSVATMRASLEDDETMKIKVQRGAPRVAEEKRNVTLVRVFLLAIKREDDNDFHIIIGDSPDASASELFNIELSGVPATGSSRTALQAMRDKFENEFDGICGQRYARFEDGVEADVGGSLFFDIDHDAGVVGPQGMRPNTAWEIHPITSLDLR